MLRFIVFHNNELIKTYELDKLPIYIGRLPENDVSIANMGISRRHSRIEQEASRKYVLSDLNSLNGTFLNNNKIKKTVINSGDIISIGKYSIRFEVLDDPAPADTSNQSEAGSPDQPAGNVPPETTDASAEATPSEELSSAGQGGPVLIETNKHVVYKIDKPVISIGNSENDDIFVSGFLVGDNQIFIEKKSDGRWITATKMMGRIKINGKKTKKHQLKHKDRIEIGKSIFRYMENG